ncbi:hypothetical protein J7J83_03145 [bacterium]|nr:hypothetical protein [bacterium]
MTEQNTLTWYVVPTVIAIFIFILALFLEFGARRNKSIKRLTEVLRTGAFLDSTVLSITIGILLIISGAQNYLFAPGISLGESLPHLVFKFSQIIIGIGLVLGIFTRLCTVGIMTIFIGGFFFFDPLKMLDYSVFMGIGLFLFLVHKDVLSFSFFFHPIEKKHFLDKYRKQALPILRFITGFGLIIIALHHNIIDPTPAINFIQEKPLLNIMQSIFGMGNYPNTLLVFNTGIFGILIGALLTFGLLEKFISILIAIGLILTVIIGGISFLPIAVPYFAIVYIIITGNQFEEREIKETI